MSRETGRMHRELRLWEMSATWSRQIARLFPLHCAWRRNGHETEDMLSAFCLVLWPPMAVIQTRMLKNGELVMRVQKPRQICYTDGVGTSRRILGPTQNLFGKL